MSVTRIHSSDEVVLSPVKAVPRPHCAENPDDWDLDTGTPDTWRHAVRMCHRCPLFTQCAELAQTLTTRGQGPRAMIWAGIGYDNSGNVIQSLDRHRATPIDHKRPTTIIRTGPTYREPGAPEKPHLHEVSSPGSPRRQIVIRRGALRPTGTDNA